MLGYPGALATDSPVQSLLQRLHTFLMVYDDPLMSVPMPKSARNRVAMLRRHIPMIGGQRPPNPLLRIRARLLALQADARTSTTLRCIATVLHGCQLSSSGTLRLLFNCTEQAITALKHMSLSGMTVDEMNQRLESSTLAIIRISPKSWLVTEITGTPIYIEHRTVEAPLLSVQEMHLTLTTANSVLALYISDEASTAIEHGVSIVYHPQRIAELDFGGLQDAYRSLLLTCSALPDAAVLTALVQRLSDVWPSHQISELRTLNAPLSTFSTETQVSITTQYANRKDNSIEWAHPTDLTLPLPHLPFATPYAWMIADEYMHVQVREYNGPYCTRQLPIERVLPSKLTRQIKEMAKTARQCANAVYSIMKVCLKRGCAMTQKTCMDIASYYTQRTHAGVLVKRTTSVFKAILREHLPPWTGTDDVINRSALPPSCNKQIAENYIQAMEQCVLSTESR